MIYLWLMLLALILLIVFAPLVFLIRIITIKSGLEDYFHTVAVGIDQLGGSIIYGELDYSISGYTHFLAVNGIYWAGVFERFINFCGRSKTHCKDAFEYELRNAGTLTSVVIEDINADLDAKRGNLMV